MHGFQDIGQYINGQLFLVQGSNSQNCSDFDENSLILFCLMQLYSHKKNSFCHIYDMSVYYLVSLGQTSAYNRPIYIHIAITYS